VTLGIGKEASWMREITYLSLRRVERADARLVTP
jgi:hypothetical protein